MFKMSRAGFALALLCTVFTACNNTDPMKDFVAQDVKLEVKSSGSQVLASGKLNFSQISYSTSYETVCDHYECGGYRPVCYGGGTVCSPGRQVCTPGRQVCEVVRRCTGGGCTNDTVCRTVGGGCHTVPGSCHTRPPVCHNEYVSRTCTRNCRQEPFTRRHTTTVPSPITVALKGVSDAKAIKGLHLGVKTNSSFIQAFDDPTMRPKGAEALWDVLAKTDKTVLAAAAKGLKLVQGQNFLTLPADYKPGDALLLEAQFEPAADDKDTLSGCGSAVDFPELSFERK